MQSGRKPLESQAEYDSRMDDYLENIRISHTRIVTCLTELETAMKTLEDEYNLNFSEWRAVFSELNVIEEKTAKFIEDFIMDRN